MSVMTSIPSRSAVARPPVAALGLHRLFLLLMGLNLAVGLATLPLYGSFGLSIDWSTFAYPVLAIGFAFTGWMAHVSTPGRASEWPVAESFVVFVLIAVCCTVVTPAQYLAVAMNRPLADPWLARADAFLGISVPDAVRWTSAHPRVASLLLASYGSLMPQFAAPIVILGLYYRDRYALWEYAFNFHVCLFMTLLGLALFPAMCAFSYFGFESLIDQTGFIRHFDALRNGTFGVLRLKELEGLITFPSFHVAGGLMVTWAFRRHRWMFLGLVVLNTLMIASTVLLGPHYAVDIIASLALFAASTWICSRWAHRLIAIDPVKPRVSAAAGR